MSIARPSLLSLLLLSVTCLGLGGCGQKGPLFIPNDDSPPNSPAPVQAQPATPSEPTPATPSAQ